MVGINAVDSMMDPLTNNTKENILKVNGNYVKVNPGIIPRETVILMVQAFRTGSPDIDAKDYSEEFFLNPILVMENDASRFYVINAYRPFITKENWRFDCGVAGYDNTNGLPPNIPTILRFEDYSNRVFLYKSPEYASAHVNAILTHKRNPYNRASLAHNLLNEEITAFLKIALLSKINANGLNITMDESEIRTSPKYVGEIIDRNKVFYEKAQRLVKEKPEWSEYYHQFVNDILYEFCEFNPERLEKRINGIISQEMSAFSELVKLWPDILQETKEIKQRGLPIRRIR
ncbi:MAG: hypothetical protein N3D75_02570 [Candidatus Aenigmarchaeota archaeon]|nr:hypothetical protein [Candidatus Aenigmarchaeota archaeon]